MYPDLQDWEKEAGWRPRTQEERDAFSPAALWDSMTWPTLPPDDDADEFPRSRLPISSLDTAVYDRSLLHFPHDLWGIRALIPLHAYLLTLPLESPPAYSDLPDISPTAQEKNKIAKKSKYVKDCHKKEVAARRKAVLRAVRHDPDLARLVPAFVQALESCPVLRARMQTSAAGPVQHVRLPVFRIPDIEVVANTTVGQSNSARSLLHFELDC